MIAIFLRIEFLYFLWLLGSLLLIFQLLHLAEHVLFMRLYLRLLFVVLPGPLDEVFVLFIEGVVIGRHQLPVQLGLSVIRGQRVFFDLVAEPHTACSLRPRSFA